MHLYEAVAARSILPTSATPTPAVIAPVGAGLNSGISRHIKPASRVDIGRIGIRQFWRPLAISAMAIVCCIAGQIALPAVAEAARPLCLDFKLTTEHGTLKSEIRPYNGDPIGYYTWWWFINDLSHRPGEYEWHLFVNKSPITKIQKAEKDDMLHFGQARYRNGKNIWNSGDVLHVDGLHTAPDGTVYITPLNECTVP
ncbi:hypothetical protein [Nocardia gamkensis]|uniref:hypothetical protein n=1 Tax=Nocardia gamkensis TaxID=352869 RepID=UPI0037C86F18